jgi:hypothetical protein
MHIPRNYGEGELREKSGEPLEFGNVPFQVMPCRIVLIARLFS